MWLFNLALKWFGNLPLQTKLYMSFGWMCLFTAILAAVSLTDIYRIQHSTGSQGAIASGSESMILGLLAVILIINFVMAWRLTHLIGDPIVRACQVLEEVSHRDLTVSAPVESTDEVGQMCSALNRTVANMHNMLASLMDNADGLARAAAELSDQTTRSSGNCNLQSQLAQGVLETSRGFAENESAIAQHSHDAAQAGRESSHAAGKGREIMTQAASTMESIATSSRGIGDLMKRLDQRTREIDKSVNAIRDISTNTNLLALNASIEAARAGEQGRGFAVVAGEVRHLAENTRSATEEIARMVKAIQQETAETVLAIESNLSHVMEGQARTEEAQRMLGTIIQRAALTLTLAEATAAAAAEQSIRGREITANAERVAELASGSLACSAEVSITMENVLSSAHSLSAIVRQYQL